MKQLSRRILLLLALPAMLAVGAQDALAQQEGVSYYYHKWDYDASQGKNRVFNFGANCTNYKVLDASTSLSASKDFGVGDNREWDNGGYKWVVVKGNVTINTLSVIGEGHLILTDGCKLTCTGGVWLSGNSTLNIYSQSSGENEGQLIVTQSNKGCAGIGSWKQEEANGSPVSMGSLTIHGGHIEATGAQYGAGIGGGEDRGIQSGCTYTQYGGDVRAIGGEYAAGLGGGYAGHQGGDVTIYGGKIYARSGAEGAGIGGGSPSHGGGAGGRVTIWGGIVEARNAGIEKYGAGIGGGYESVGGEINIHGGEVNVESYKLPGAYGGRAGAAIGNGGSIINITGGKIRAISIGKAAGIGYDGYRSSWDTSIISSSCQVNISGGTIEARNPGAGAGISAGPGGRIIISGSADIKAYSGQKEYDHSSAAIGGPENSSYGYIEINGGTVYAESTGVGAGIGGGYKSTGGTIVINGGNITAKGGADTYCDGGMNGEGNSETFATTFTSAGIGGGVAGDGGKIFINGGTVYAQGGTIDKVEYYGKTYSGSSAAGIGGGSEETTRGGTNDAGAGADVKITGGTVIAIGGIDKDAAAIGHSVNLAKKEISYYDGTLSIYDGAKVTSGASENVALVTDGANRVSSCHKMRYAKIEACDHAAFGNYTYINDNLHTAHCLYCAYSKEQAHEYTDGKCACGKKKEVKPETVSITLYRAKDATSGKYDNGLLLHVVKGEKYTITTCNAPEGLTFMGWMKDPSEAPADYEMRDGDFMKLVDAGKELTTEGDITTINLYARYRYRYTDEWTWSDDWSSATVTIKLGDQTIVENQVAKISDNSLAPTAENPNGTFGKSATYAWKKGNDIVYNFGDAVSRPVSLALTLSDDEDNSALLEQAVGTTYETVTLSGRTLYKDGSWNTLCLPFAVTTASGPLSGDGVVAQVLDAEKSSLSDDGKLALTFKDAPATIPAGLPFVIKWNAEGSDIVSPTFNDVTITTPQPASADFRGGSFVGQFSPFQITSGNLNAIVLLTDDNTLGYSKSTRTLRSCRAHFEVLREMTSGARLMTGYSIIFGPSAEADPTAVRSVTVGGGDNDGWYTLGGQRLSSRPTRQGIYVRQGRKVVIKQ
jgi:hypothetical protein